MEFEKVRGPSPFYKGFRDPRTLYPLYDKTCLSHLVRRKNVRTVIGTPLTYPAGVLPNHPAKKQIVEARAVTLIALVQFGWIVILTTENA